VDVMGARQTVIFQHGAQPFPRAFGPSRDHDAPAAVDQGCDMAARRCKYILVFIGAFGREIAPGPAAAVDGFCVARSFRIEWKHPCRTAGVNPRTEFVARQVKPLRLQWMIGGATRFLLTCN